MPPDTVTSAGVLAKRWCSRANRATGQARTANGRQGRSCDALVTEVAGEYLQARRAAGHRDLISALAVAPVLGYLRGLGAAPTAATPVPRTPADRLLAEFAGYLARERGLSPASLSSYVHHARPFLTGLAAPLGTALAGLSAAQVTAFMTGHRGQWGTAPPRRR
jgi:integrase/recombinase XerD